MPAARAVHDYRLTQLQVLEAESIHLLREVAAEFERPVLLFSGGKDSVVMAHVAAKAFWPAKLPFPVMHVDTGHNFPEVITFRDEAVEALGARLIVASVQDSIDSGRCREHPARRRATGCRPPRCSTRSSSTSFDAVMGGARRDEEKARAKERFFSFRDEFGQWDPKNQRPELWNLYNGRHNRGEHIRVSRCRTGPSSTSGSTSKTRASSCRRSTSRTAARCSAATTC